MFGSVIIDVAIGLIFVFLLVSLLVTTANEFIAALLSARAKWLKKGVVQLLGSEYQAKLYAHPLIEGSFLSKKGPSYIASRAFSTVLLDIAADSDKTLLKTKEIIRKTLEQIPNDANVDQFKTELSKAIETVAALGGTANTIASDLSNYLRGINADGYRIDDARNGIRALVDGAAARHIGAIIANIEDEKIRVALMTLFEDAERDLGKLKENVEIWFNQAMDRVGGWYKRKSQWVITALALGVTLFLNVDALLIIEHLNTQSGLRDAVVAQAKAFGESAPSAGTARSPGGGGSANAANASGASPEEVMARAHAVEGELSKLSLPIGWFMPPEPSKKDEEIAKFRQENLLVLPLRKGADKWAMLDGNELSKTVLFHLVGWLLTALAASLGAPFWFDTLNKFMSIRAAGKAPEEKPKAPKEVPTPLEPGQSPREADRIAGAGRA